MRYRLRREVEGRPLYRPVDIETVGQLVDQLLG